MKTLLVLSCKGGVGKTTIATAIAKSFAEGNKVGLLDLDITNPCTERISGTTDCELNVTDKVYPAKKGNLKVMSTSFILPSNNTAIMWKGERKRRMIFQFLKRVEWGDIDYLIVDTPPGTSDETLSAIENLDSVDGAVVVTTPQGVSLMNVRKTITMCRKLKIPIVGLIENMSGFKCPKCGHTTFLFKSGDAKKLAEELRVPYLGSLPIDPKICSEGDDGRVGTIMINKDFEMMLVNIRNFLGVKPIKVKPVKSDILLAKLEAD